MKTLQAYPMWIRTTLLCVVLLLSSSDSVLAHKLQVEPIVVVFRPQQEFLSAEFVGNVQDITQSVGAEDRDQQGDGYTKSVEKRVETYFNEHLKVKQGATLARGSLVSLTHQGNADPAQDKFRLFLRYPRPAGTDRKAALTVQNTLLDYLPNARVILSLGGLQKTMPYGDSVTVNPDAVATNLLTNLWEFMALGVEHIFTGPDHMLFILALLLVSTNLKGLIKTLTGFTIAHTITLMLSALSIVILPERLTDVLIAVSIVYVGVENIYLKNDGHRFWIASGFGLIHGFGFSGVLRSIGLPPGAAQFWCLLSFNLGVETAQVIICLLAFPLLMWWRVSNERRAKYGGMSWKSVTNIASVGVALAGGYWLVQRLFA